ncbi:MAG: type IX secretion system membrane protein PorP/SprF [Bacteroidales bacterium]|nr:type IX secretion system membrane protein PorP/SprF [Bacteroidales bacterium]
MRFTLIIFFSIYFINIHSQQDHQVSQFMYDNMSFNPASVGSRGGICATGILREQWTGIDGSPRDIILNAHMPFKLFKKDHGVGLSFFNETIGNYEDIDLRLAYAYRANVGDGKLGIGVGVNFQNRGINPDWLTINEIMGGAGEQSDIGIPGTDEKIWATDVNFGIFYYTEELYFGISSTHINESSFKYVNESSDEGTIKIKRHYYLTSGYTMQLANPSFELVPSVLFQSDGAAHKIDLNAQLVYNKKFWGGVSIRPGSSFIGMIGFEILNGAKVGFAYDFPTSAITNYYKTSYEILLNYCFKIGVEKSNQKYKSIRFL